MSSSLMWTTFSRGAKLAATGDRAVHSLWLHVNMKVSADDARPGIGNLA